MDINWDFIIKFFILGILPYIIYKKMYLKDLSLFTGVHLFPAFFALSIFVGLYNINPYDLNPCGILNWSNWFFIISLLIILVLYFRNRIYYSSNNINDDEFKIINIKLERLKDEIDKKNQIESEKKEAEKLIKENEGLNKKIKNFQVYNFQYSLLYIMFFCLLSLFMVKNSIYRSYINIEGVVTDNIGKPIANAKITYSIGNNTSLIEIKSDKSGEFTILIPDSTLRKVTSLSVMSNNYELFTKKLSGESSLKYTIIELTSIK